MPHTMFNVTAYDSFLSVILSLQEDIDFCIKVDLAVPYTDHINYKNAVFSTVAFCTYQKTLNNVLPKQNLPRLKYYFQNVKCYES